jgi:hypothetical protein
VKRLLATLALCTIALVAAPSAQAAHSRACGKIVNPYAGTRYEGVDITRIRAAHATCKTARRVARGAHNKALGLTPPPSGIRHFHWHGWSVTGDLRGDHDSYVATRGSKRVRWRF